MALDDLYQQDTDRALNAMSVLPAPSPVSTRSAWGAPWRALKAAGADVAGSTLDILKGFGAANAIALEADPVARAALGDRAIQEGAAEGRRQIATGEAMTSGIGQIARDYSRAQRPDPVTASTAENVVFGVVRPLAKLVAGGVVAGPFGIIGAAGEEGLTASEDLRKQGVDIATRTKVGGLTAGFTAATALLPLAGGTLKATAALYVAGGPGAFVAQQAATSAILENANYSELAKLYDPLDPVGLAVSALIPLPFVAHGAARNVGHSGAARQIAADLEAGRAPDGKPLPMPERVPVTPDDVDGTLVHNLTLQADQQGVINAAKAGEQMAEELVIARRPPVIEAEIVPPQKVQAAEGAELTATAKEGEAPALNQNLLTDTETPPGAPKADPFQQSTAMRVAELEKQAGDMVVRLDEQGSPVAIRDEITRIRREVVEGTDTELGTLDADLLRVAAECALSVGAS